MKERDWQKLGLGALGAVGLLLLVGAKPARGHGTILGQGVSYTPTMDEWLWLCRACYGESDEHEGRVAAAWAMVQRFVALRQTASESWGSKSFASLVRSFSQPVNPIWSSTNACTQDGRGCCGSRCSQADIDRRRFYQSRSWDWFREREPDLYFMVMSFAAGLPPANPVPGMTNFADESQSRCNDIAVAGNRFCNEPPLQGSVSVVPA